MERIKNFNYRIIIPIIIIGTVISGCKKNDALPPAESEIIIKVPSDEYTPDFTEESLNELIWMNEPNSYEIKDGSMRVTVEKGTDFFNNPEDLSVTATAPFLFQEMTGDFVATALVKPDFTSMWNAVALMVHIDDDHWIKFAFENSDATGKSIVSVVTKGVSDDANGVILRSDNEIWLKLVRKNNIYSMFWSKYGSDYKMVRLTTLPETDSVKIGVEFQSPVGDSATHTLHSFKVVETTVEDLRKGK